MMRSVFDDVLEFERLNGFQLPHTPPAAPSPDVVDLRYRLVNEEAAELLRALRNVANRISDGQPITLAHLAEITDGALDTIFVCLGTLIHFGVDPTDSWVEVCRTNLAKFGPGSWVDGFGKRRKPKDWVAPDIEGILSRQAPLALTHDKVEG